MSSNLSENNIVDYIFEDQDYLPPQQKAIEVVECSSFDDENVEGNEFVEILCLNDGNLLTLLS